MGILKVFIYRIRTLNKYLVYIFFIALISIIIIEGFLIHIPEWFTGASLIASIYTKICYAYMTSLIFYFINVHYQSEKGKVKTVRYIYNKLGRLTRYKDSLVFVIQSNGFSKTEEIYEGSDMVLNACKNINPQLSVSMYTTRQIKFNNYFELFHFINTESKVHIRDLLLLIDYLNIDIVESIMNIEDTLEQIDVSKGHVLANEDLKPWVSEINNYISACNKLDTLKYDKYKLHIEEHSTNLKKTKKDEVN
ncbi:hypothetical protein [Peribacillus frigoritolerans]|uniref:hypothetical protein n=1 Tax=Peribacillus frigoritolerans TaxID=450367 RepID=UPI00364268E0